MVDKNSRLAPEYSQGISDFINDHVTDRVVPLAPVRLNFIHATEDTSYQPIVSGGGANENSNIEVNTPVLGGGILGATKPLNKKPPAPATKETKLAYGKTTLASFKSSHDDHDVNDRVHGLQNENLKLKEKENLLELEIKKMQTKLHRIDELIGKSRGSVGAQDSDYGRLSRELED